MIYGSQYKQYLQLESMWVINRFLKSPGIFFCNLILYKLIGFFQNCLQSKKMSLCRERAKFYNAINCDFLLQYVNRRISNALPDSRYTCYLLK